MIRNNKTNDKRGYRLKWSTLAGLAFFVSQFSASALAEDEKFDRQAYLGFGAGMSYLAPVAVDGADIELDEDTSNALQVYFGRDFTPRLTGELHYSRLADIGRAGLPNTSFTDISLSGLLYLTPSQNRLGVAPYTRLGIGEIKVENSAGVYRDHPVHVMAGLGLEYAMPNGLAARAEYLYHDEDASVASMSVLYRIGANAPRYNELPELPVEPLAVENSLPAVVSEPAAPVPTPQPIPEPISNGSMGVAEVNPVTADTDAFVPQSTFAESTSIGADTSIETGSTDFTAPADDSIVDLGQFNAQQNPQASEPAGNLPSPYDTVFWQEETVSGMAETTPMTTTTPMAESSPMAELPESIVSLDNLRPERRKDCGDSPCAELGDRFAGVTFKIGSDILTAQSIDLLYGVVEAMFDNSDLSLRLQSHTDNRGNAAENVELSKRRAITVYKYLIANGVAANRLSARAFGGEKPITSNQTAAGRRMNRRVELIFSSSVR